MNSNSRAAADPFQHPPCFDGLNEHDIHHACALRFDGERYAKATGFDAEAAVQVRHMSRVMPDASLHLHRFAMYHVLHGQIYANGLDRASGSGRTWHLLRLFFMYSAGIRVPEEYRPDDLTWHHRWEHECLPRWRDMISFIHSSKFYGVLPEQFAEAHESWTRSLLERGLAP